MRRARSKVSDSKLADAADQAASEVRKEASDAASVPVAAPPPETQTDPAAKAWQQAHDSVQAAFEQANVAFDASRDPQQRKVLSALADTLSDQLADLNREDMRNRTISLQAASSQLLDGEKKLADLKQQLSDIAQDFAMAAEVIDGIDSAISGVKGFLAILA
jgi:hypothetical protein